MEEEEECRRSAVELNLSTLSEVARLEGYCDATGMMDVSCSQPQPDPFRRELCMVEVERIQPNEAGHYNLSMTELSWVGGDDDGEDVCLLPWAGFCPS